MIIKWLGHASFFIQSDKTSLITDPFNPSIGLKFPEVSSDIVTISHNHFDHSYREGVKGNPTVIDSPGEYEKGGITIKGIKSFHDQQNGNIRGENIIFKYLIEGISIAHLGDLGHLLNDEQVNQLLPLDIVMIPIGGVYTIEPEEAVKVVSQLNPIIILPMHYHTIDRQASDHLASIDNFSSAINIKPEKLAELNISKDTLPVTQKIISFDVAFLSLK